MATRSIIAVQIDENKYQSIYCHWDGYPIGKGGVGDVLFNHYQDVEKIKELMELGNLSSLGKSPDEGTVAYARDCGELYENNLALEGSLSFIEREFKESDCEYLFVYKDSRWFWYGERLEMNLLESSTV